MDKKPTMKKNLKYFFHSYNKPKGWFPDLDDLRSMFAREKSEEVIYQMADVMKQCWCTSLCHNGSTVMVEFGEKNRAHARKVEEFLFFLKKLGEMLDEEESNIQKQ